MLRTFRLVLVVICAVQVVLAVAFAFRWPLATSWWPFPGTTPLTYLFISSIFAAAAASTLWATVSGHHGSLAGIGLDYLAILTPVSFLAFGLAASTGDPRFTSYGIACVLGALFGLGLFAWSVRLPLDRGVPMPGPVRWSFVVFITALVIVATQLVLKVPNVMPWKITPELSVGIGCMFFGAALYFAYGLMRPSWSNTAGQLAGFLAYDVVLIVPFLQKLPTVPEPHRVNLIIYTTVVAYSGLLAAYYLFVHPRTRMVARNG